MDGNASELLKAIFEKLEVTENNLKSEIQELKGELQVFKKMNTCIVEKFTDLEKKCNDQQKTILELQKQINRKNIIIHGIQQIENEKNLDSRVTQILNERLQTNISADKIEQVYRLGRFNERKDIPIKVKFANYKDKEEVMKSRSMLKGTKIFINNDLPHELRMKEMEERKRKREQTLTSINNSNGERERSRKQPREESPEEERDLAERITQEMKKLKESSRRGTGQHNIEENQKKGV